MFNKKPTSEWIDRYYYDIDRGIYVSETELRRDYENGISEMPTFEAYVNECITNGCLEEV